MEEKAEVNFCKGYPSADLLPVALLQESSAKALAAADASQWFGYGPDEGSERMRTFLAEYLTKEYSTHVDASHLVLVGGASHAIDMACTLLAQTGETVIVEDPSYFLAFQIFRDHGLCLHSVGTGTGGIDLTELEAKLHGTGVYEGKAVKPKLLYTIPTFNNPSGWSMSETDRHRLIELAHEFDFYIVADEVYQLIYFREEDRPPLPLAVLESLSGRWEEGRVVSVSSFSKSLAPGLRLGYVHSPFENVSAKFAACGHSVSGGVINHLATGLVLPAFLDGSFDRNLRMLRSVYASRCQVLLQGLKAIKEAVKEKFDAEVTYMEPKGGYFVWVSLPSAINVTDMLDGRHTLVPAEKSEVDVKFLPGSRCSSNPDSPTNSLRLCYAAYNEEELAAGMRQLKAVILAAMAESRS